MQRILITSGPTREYLDPVRYLTNGSTGRMGCALAEAVLQQGNLPVVVSGAVSLSYPEGSEVHRVETTEQMLQCCMVLFPDCAGVIGAAAPCDFRPITFSQQKLSKPKEENGIAFQFLKTPDILACLGQIKRSDQWSVGFALETENGQRRAVEKLQQKYCDFVVLNNPNSIGSEEAFFQIFDAAGKLRREFAGSKRILAKEILQFVHQ